MYRKPAKNEVPVHCPVGNHAEIGIREKGKAATYFCSECEFLFPVSEEGFFLKPIKYYKRKVLVTCDCGGCGH